MDIKGKYAIKFVLKHAQPETRIEREVKISKGPNTVNAPPPT
jgi:hypothetical protein